MARFFSCFILLVSLFVTSTVFAGQLEIKRQISFLQPVKLEYGVNKFRLGNPNIIITKAKLPSEVAGYGDVYSVMYWQNDEWQLVQFNDHKFNIITWPHTEEDAVSNIHFFSLSTGNNLEELYLLKADREIEETIPSASHANIELYKIEESKDFEYMQFTLIDKFKTKEKYCNIGKALNKELSIVLSKTYVECK